MILLNPSKNFMLFHILIMIKVSDLFTINYWVSLELLNCIPKSPKDWWIPFISRTAKNNWTVEYVEILDDIEPNPWETISVACGGSVLSSFYQKKPYYSWFHILYLKPKKPLTDLQMLYYCFVLEANKYKYNYGRQANRTLKDILIPDIDEISFDLEKISVEKPSNKNILNQELDLNTKNRKSFRYDEVFDIKKWYYNKKPDHIDVGNIPFIWATEYGNGVTDCFTQEEIENHNKAEWSSFDDIEKKIFKGNAITVSNNGSVGYAFYQPIDFTCSHDVNPLYLKNKELNKYIAMFLVTLIEQEQYRWAYGRKRRPSRMPDSIIKLPVDKNNDPDREFMEKYIKSLPYSASL